MFTDKQMVVLTLLPYMKEVEVKRLLGISHGAMGSRMREIYRKLGVPIGYRARVIAVMEAIRQGYLSIEYVAK